MIPITRGLIVRNIIRTDVYRRLKANTNLRVIFLVLDRAVEDFRKEFRDAGDEIIPITTPVTNRLRSIYLKIFARCLVWTDSSKMISFVGKFSEKKRNSFVHQILFTTVGFFGRFSWIKKIFRWAEMNMFPEKYFDSLFRGREIDVLFTPDIQGKIDTALLKSAKRFRVKTVAMTKGWDTLCQRLIRALPDTLIVQSETVKQDAIQYQNIPGSRVMVAGFPQFDFYHKKEWFMGREEYCQRFGLDPARAILFFGSSGAWTSHDSLTMHTIYQLMRENAFSKPCSLILRPHFSNVTHKPYRDFTNLPNVYVDDTYTLCNFIDNWNPSDEDNKMLVNTLRHADIVITYLSTLVLEAAIVDKPIINLGFGGQFDTEGRDVTWRLFQRTHYQPIVKTNAVTVVQNTDELIHAINNYLKEPSLHAEGRKTLRDQWCYGADGLAGSRVATHILRELNL